MEINVTLLSQIVAFILYVFFCIKFVWPYINKIIEKRENDICEGYVKVKKLKIKLNNLKKKIGLELKNTEKKVLNILSEAKYKSDLLIKDSKIKANYEYKKIILDAKIKMKNERKIMHQNFNKEIFKVINFALIKITNGVFDKKLDDKFIKNIINKL